MTPIELSKVQSLHPSLISKAIKLHSAMHSLGVPIYIYCTYRSDREQSDLYAKGRTIPGEIVTYAKAGESPHNVTRKIVHPQYGEIIQPAALAFDVAFGTAAKCSWEGPWEDMAYIAKRFLGLEWGGDFSFPDKGHFQSRAWKDMRLS